MQNIQNIQDIVAHFQIKGEVDSINPLKIGHINDSYIITNKKKGHPSYFLQRINHHIFRDVAGLQQNISLVTDHLRRKLSEAGETDLERKVLQLITTTDNKLYHKDAEGSFWRMYINIEDAQSFDAINPELAYKAGCAFGRFQTMLSDLSQEKLIETIPNFHNMEFRLEEFNEALKLDKAGRASNPEAQYYIKEIQKRADAMCLPQRLYREGKLARRINHCDTKVNNMLFNKQGEPICIVDLDTVMPGLVLSDFGDFMRTAANTGAEDDRELSKVGINLEIFEAYTKGYLENAAFLSDIEIEYLAFGAKLLSYMQTVRFFTDYLNGDTYYKIQHPEHNLQRTKAQFKLLQSQEEHFPTMQEIVNRHKKK